MHKEIIADSVRGFVQLFHVFDDGKLWVPQTKVLRNTVMYQWADIAARRMFSNDFREFVVNGMYIEFCNVATPSTPVGTSTPPRTNTVDGFLDTSNFPAVNCDLVRVPILTTSIRSSNELNYLLGNTVTITAQSVGNVGSLFSTAYENSQNSKIYGTTLAAIRDESDITADLLFSRIQFDAGDQLVKPVGGQVGVVWSIEFQ